MTVVKMQTNPQNGATTNNANNFSFKTPELNMDYVRSLSGILRVAEGALSLAALICTAEGFCEQVVGQYAFAMFVLILSMLQAILIFIVYVLLIDRKIKFVDTVFVLLINDLVILVLYFVSTTTTLLSIGGCVHERVARIIAAVFTIGLFITLIGLNYCNYVKWQEKNGEKEFDKNSGTTVTQASPTVLT